MGGLFDFRNNVLTTVLLTHTGFTEPAAVARHEHGWEAVLDSLGRRVLEPQRA